MSKRTIFRVLPLFTLFSACAFAGPITINFTSSLLNGVRGQTLTFSANLANTSASTVFLNGDSVNITAPLFVDDTKFLLNSPLSMAGGATTAPFQILDVTIPSNAQLGLYPGTFNILGGSTPSDFSVVGTATFAVNVIPEPATTALTGLVLTALIARCWRRQKE